MTMWRHFGEPSSEYDRARSNDLARRTGATDADLAHADAFAAELDRHDAWGLAFCGYCNPAGYGYAFDPSRGIAADGWNSYQAFTRLAAVAQTAVVFRSLERGHDADRESARYFLKFERGIIIHADRPF